ADGDRRDQRRIRADESALADLGPVLGEAVVIAGDRSRADIRARADMRVAEISEMIGLGAIVDAGRLYLDEVANVYVGAEVRAGPQPGERTDARILADPRALKMRERS